MPTLDWLDRQTAFSVANNTATHVLRPHATGHVFGDAAAARDNLLIQGDNLQALKALLPFYRGQVKCIFIDPPYNTKSAFDHYDDNLEHSQWLSMMLPRLQVFYAWGTEGVYQLDVQQYAKPLKNTHDMPNEHMGNQRIDGRSEWANWPFEDVLRYFTERTHIDFEPPVMHPENFELKG
jgi:hypothetical protein